MQKILQAKKENTDVKLLGTGEPLRSLVYVKDVCDVINYFALNDIPNGAYNIGHDNGVSIKQIAQAIIDIVDFKGNIIWGDAKDNGAMVKVLNYTKLDTVYPGRQKTDLSSGLEKAIEYINGKLR